MAETEGRSVLKQGMPPEEAVKRAEAELKKIYVA